MSLSPNYNKKENSLARSNRLQRLPKVSKTKISQAQNSFSNLYDVEVKKRSKNSVPPKSKPNLPSLQKIDRDKKQ